MQNILCGLFFWVAPKIFIWQPDYSWLYANTVKPVLSKHHWKGPKLFVYGRDLLNTGRIIFWGMRFCFLDSFLLNNGCL